MPGVVLRRSTLVRVQDCLAIIEVRWFPTNPNGLARTARRRLGPLTPSSIGPAS